METVFRKKEESEIFNSKESLSERDISIEILGQTTERTMEDRSVYVNIKYGSQNITTWINGEKAIELGQIFIRQGSFALEANMINHQKIHTYNTFKRFLNDGIVKYVHLKKVVDNPNNYGKGFHEFKITSQFHEFKEPKYYEDFNFNDILYISNILEDEFDKSLKVFGGKDKVIFHNYKNKFINEKLNNQKLRETKINRILNES